MKYFFEKNMHTNSYVLLVLIHIILVCISVVRGSVYLYRWLLVVTIVVVVLASGSWCVFVRVRARRRRQTDRRSQYSEVSSTTPQLPTYVIEPSTSRSPRRRRGSMESVTLFAVKEC